MGKHTILMIEADEAACELIETKLTEWGYRVATARDGDEALGIIHEAAPDLILIGATTPGLDGFGTCRRLKKDVEAASIPVLFLADETRPIDRMYGLTVGGLDYLRMPPDESELRARVSLALRLKALQDKLGSPAEEDGLTGLLNRSVFEEEFHRECNRSRRYDSLFALVVVDIDHFKTLNGSYGPMAGDRVLKEVAAILRDKTRESDYAARWGGDEFIVMLPEADLPKAIGFAKKLYAAITEHRFQCGDETVRLDVSIGITSIQNVGGRDPGEVVAVVHECLDTAKEGQTSKICYHTCGEKHMVRV